MQAATDLGGYHKEGVDWLVGTSLTLRPSFETRPLPAYREIVPAFIRMNERPVVAPRWAPLG